MALHGKKKSSHKRRKKGNTLLASAMREVHENTPSTVTRAKVKGKKKEAMLRAIAFSKARKAGAKIPFKKGRGFSHKGKKIL